LRASEVMEAQRPKTKVEILMDLGHESHIGLLRHTTSGVGLGYMYVVVVPQCPRTAVTSDRVTL
jgi:hypothetical protein